MLKANIVVEGYTEFDFVREIFNPYLEPKGIYLNPKIVTTKLPIGSEPSYKGGFKFYEKIKNDVKSLLGDTSVFLVTTMIDFYGLPTDFPGYYDDKAQKGLSHQRVKYLEEKFKDDIGHRNFLPYISTHEFEALLFSEPETIVREVRSDDAEVQNALHNIAKKYNTPEEINKDNPPSKRIKAHLAEYDKRVHGSLIAVEIGVEKMREKCPHFNEWLTELEKLATT